METTVCRECGSDQHVHDDLCRRCRRRLEGVGERLEAERELAPREPELEPAHDRPWRHLGGA